MFDDPDPTIFIVKEESFRPLGAEPYRWECPTCGSTSTKVRARPTWGTATEWPRVVCATCDYPLTEED